MSAVALFCIGSLALSETPAGIPGPVYDHDRLVLPAKYREWIYLSTGFDMNFSAAASPGHHMFDNVFAEPGAYKSFLETGTWPDKTLLVLEVRGALRRWVGLLSIRRQRERHARSADGGLL